MGPSSEFQVGHASAPVHIHIAAPVPCLCDLVVHDIVCRVAAAIVMYVTASIYS